MISLQIKASTYGDIDRRYHELQKAGNYKFTDEQTILAHRRANFENLEWHAIHLELQLWEIRKIVSTA